MPFCIGVDFLSAAYFRESAGTDSVVRFCVSHRWRIESVEHSALDVRVEAALCLRSGRGLHGSNLLTDALYHFADHDEINVNRAHANEFNGQCAAHCEIEIGGCGHRRE